MVRCCVEVCVIIDMTTPCGVISRQKSRSEMQVEVWEAIIKNLMALLCCRCLRMVFHKVSRKKCSF